MKKVVYVVPILTPYAIARFQVLAKEMGIDLHVIVEKSRTDERNGSGGSYQELNDCHTYLLESREHGYQLRNTKSGYAINESRKYSFGLRALVRKIDPDIVIVCNSTQILFLAGPRTYKLGVVVEDTPRAEEGRKPLNRWVKRMLMGTADFYLPFNSDAVEFLRKNKLTKKQYRSSWSVELPLFSTLSGEERTEKRAQLGIAHRTSYVCVAALIPRKGILQLLDAWVSMPADFLQNNELHLIGTGPLEDQIAEKIKAHQQARHFLRGGMTYQSVSEFMQCSDILVLPTLEDVWGLVVMEAMACGLPVLTTPYAGARELIREGETGYLFDVQDPQSIRDMLERMSGSDYREMGRKARRLIEDYSNENVMRKTAEILESI